MFSSCSQWKVRKKRKANEEGCAQDAAAFNRLHLVTSESPINTPAERDNQAIDALEVRDCPLLIQESTNLFIEALRSCPAEPGAFSQALQPTSTEH